MEYKHKDLVGLKGLTKEEILYFLDSAVEFKKLNKSPIKKADYLKGKTVINAFFENSTRTRVSFETAAKRLSADAINFTASQSSTKKGETLIDTIRNMEAMQADIFVVRHSSSGVAKFLAKNSNAAIVNGGDGLNEHPTQALLDLFTIREAKGKLEGLNISLIGDLAHSRVARSNIWAMKKLGCNIKLFGPPMMMPLEAEVFGCEIAKNMEEAVEGADVIMMLRVQLERQDGNSFPSIREYARFFGLNPKRVALAAKNPLIMHPGPINRGIELNSDVADAPCSLVLEQVENGVAIRMAVLNALKESRIK